MATKKVLALSTITILSIIGTLQLASCATDKTLEDKAIGVDVVEVVINMLHSSLIFTDDYDFLRRLALVESNFGEDPETFRADFYGGIWQLNERQYNITKDVASNPALASYHEDILSSFKINWMNSTWTQLLKPLYSVLGARLFLSTVEPIPQTLKEQANFWIAKYANNENDNAARFVELVTEWENTTKCTGKMDLLVVLDESGSIGDTDFALALQFVGNLFASYSLETVRQGLITFSSPPRPNPRHEAPYRIIFPLENNLTATEIQGNVSTIEYRKGRTWTNHAITRAIEMYNETRERPGVPKIMTLFTDGMSYEDDPDYPAGSDVSNSSLAKEAGIQSFAIGIGNYNRDELNEIAYGDLSHVFGLDDFEALTEFFYRLNAETCQIPQSPSFDETTEDTLSQNAKRFYQFTIPAEGMTVFMDSTLGQVSGYYSLDYKTPSSAFNDGEIDGSRGTFIESQKKGGRYFFKADSIVYITVQGNEAKNEYKIQAEKGNSVRDSAGLSRPASFLILLMIVASFYVYY